MNKLILQILNKDGEIIKEKKYRSLKQIQSEYGPDIDYFSWRAVWLMSQGKVPMKKTHPLNKKLYSKFRIFDDEPIILV